MEAGRLRRVGYYGLKIAGIAVLYHLAARVGLTMATVQINTSPFWPPAGIAIAALVIFGLEVSPGIALGILGGSLLTGGNPAVALGIAVGNTLEALVCAVLLRRVLRFRREMDRIIDVAGFVAVLLLGASVGATGGVATLLVSGRASAEQIAGLWGTWWIGDLLGALVVAPLLMVWGARPLRGVPRGLLLEGGAALAGVIALTWYVFAHSAGEGVFHRALIYALFPFVIWVALRLGPPGATLAVLAISGIATGGTTGGAGPFQATTTNDALMVLQTFLGVVSLTALVLAAAAAERKKAVTTLRQRAEDLATLNASTESFLTNRGVEGTCEAICRFAVTRLGLDAAWIEPEAGEGEPGLPAAAHAGGGRTIEILRATWPPAADDPVRVREGVGACASLPLSLAGRTAGILSLASADARFFAPERRLLLQSYGNLAAVALQNARLLDALEQTNRRHRALSQRLMKAQEEERLRISRELHDESGQIAAALTVQIGLLVRSLHDPAAAQIAAGELRDMVGILQRDLHRLAVNLRPAGLDHRGLVSATRQLVSEFGRQNEIQAVFGAVGTPPSQLSPGLETTVYRVIQEAMTNVLLHARARRVDVMLDFGAEEVRVIIEDDGVGFDEQAPPEDGHLGFFGMRERVRMQGGRIAIQSSAGAGTTVKVEVPYGG